MTGEYLRLTATVPLAAVGLHAYATARAVELGANGIIARGELIARGMTPDLELPLLEAGLFRLAGGDALLVTTEPLTSATIALQARRAVDAARQRSRREKPGDSGSMSRDIDPVSRESRDSRDIPENAQIAGPTAAPDLPTSHTRVRGRAAHTPSPPLLNIVNSTDSTHTVARAVRATLERSFTADEISDAGLAVVIALAARCQVDPVDAAHKAAAMGSSKTWRTRDAATTMEIAIRKLCIPSGVAAHGRTATPDLCPRAGGDQYRQLRDEVLDWLSRDVDEATLSTWLAPLQIHAVDDARVEFAAPATHHSWITDRFTEKLAQAFTEITGRRRTIDVVACSCTSPAGLQRSA